MMRAAAARIRLGLRHFAGGMGKFTSALRSGKGGGRTEIRTVREVEQIRTRTARGVGVVRADGEEIDSEGSVSGVDPKRPF